MINPITIVAGFGRCGSSLVMQMLAAGGMPTPYAEFPSYEINFARDKVLIQALQGGAIKVLDPHVNRPPMGPDYRWIWLDRDPTEQAKSMAKFWKAVMAEAPSGLPTMPEFGPDQIAKLSESFKRDRPRANGVMLKYTQCSGILKLRFEDILRDPYLAAIRLSQFCGGGLNVRAMVAAVRPRGPECLPYMLELEQIEAEPMTEAEKQWIDKASYFDLLAKWRYAPAGEQIFQGESGRYYAEVLERRRSEIGGAEHSRISREIGWRKD